MYKHRLFCLEQERVYKYRGNNLTIRLLWFPFLCSFLYVYLSATLTDNCQTCCLLNIKIATAIFSSSTHPFSVAVGDLCRCCATELKYNQGATFWTEMGQEQTPGGCLALMKNWRCDLWRPGTETLICVLFTCVIVTICPFQPSPLKFHTLCTSSNACLVLSVTLSLSLFPSRFLCLRTQQTAGRFFVTADVWWSPFFYFTSVTVFLCWHFTLIWFGRLIIAALWTVPHSASQRTCSF